MTDDRDDSPGRIKELTDGNFERTVCAEGIVVVDCWAAWCGACKPFQPVFEEAASRHAAHTFAKLDTQSESELTTKLGIEHIPALLLYRDGLLLLKQPGYFDGDALDDVIAQAESLDMAEVRRAIETEQAVAP